MKLRVLRTGRSGHREYSAAAEADGQLVGLVSVLHPETSSASRWYRRAAMLEGLVLMPGTFPENVGSFLVRHAESIAKEWDATCLCVRVVEGDNELVALYRSQGFLRDRQGDRVNGRRLFEAFTKPLAPLLETVG